ncbi:postacrosomal sheath WW domain-binding protein [Ditylenchus destructor]|nr:postacrosomal sheath WW domain-binding protein [Ditylenchus destructor]
MEGYVLPPPGYVLPPPGYVLPPPGYVLPPPGYVRPTPGYVIPPPGYVIPAPGYDLPPPGYVVPPQKPIVQANWTICKPRVESRNLGWYWTCLNPLRRRDCAHECIDEHKYLNGECTLGMHCICHCGML